VELRAQVRGDGAGRDAVEERQYESCCAQRVGEVPQPPVAAER
jgi:hypothetical protein